MSYTVLRSRTITDVISDVSGRDRLLIIIEFKVFILYIKPIIER